MPIKAINARQIFDSKGVPTIEVDLTTELGLFRAAISSEIEEKIHTVVELRDKLKQHYHGLSVMKAIENVKSLIGPELLSSNIEVTDQRRIDELLLQLDGTKDKSNLGANAILGVSVVVAKAGAAKRGVPLYRHIADLAGNTDIVLPVPAFNVLNGGEVAGNNLVIQEFMILPTGAKTFNEAMKMGSEVYHYLKIAIKKKYGATGLTVSDEGGFAPRIPNDKAALTLLKTAIKKSGYEGRVQIAIDVAASVFYKKGKYNLDFKKKKPSKNKILTAAKLKAFHAGFLKKFPIISIEDPFDKTDWKSWTAFTAANELQVIGDDLIAGNQELVQSAFEKDACNGVILKVNQIGTVTEAIDFHLKAKNQGWGTMVSHLAGETEDTFIADLVVGLSAGQIKTGAPCRSERLAKYNQLLRIEEELGDTPKYAGQAFRRPN